MSAATGVKPWDQQAQMFMLPETGKSVGLWASMWSLAIVLPKTHLQLATNRTWQQAELLASPLLGCWLLQGRFSSNRILILPSDKISGKTAFDPLTEGKVFQRQACSLPFSCTVVQQQHEARPASQVWDCSKVRSFSAGLCRCYRQTPALLSPLQYDILMTRPFSGCISIHFFLIMFKLS